MEECGDLTITGSDLKSAKGATLVKSLQTLSEELTNFEQTEEHEGLQSCAEALGDAKLLRHKDPEVKLLTACCVSDVLRIYAPDTPYSPDTLKNVFEVLIQQLNGVRDPKSGSFSRYFYLLERLAMVKSFVLMIDLECQDLIESLFEVLFDVTSKEHGVRVEGFLLEILVGIIEDLDAVPQPLLDVVLEKVVQPAKAEKPAAYALARRVLQRCSNELNAPLHHFLQSCLPNSTLERVESDVRDEWPHLVVEVASAAPDVVKYVVPQLSEVATMEEEAVRLKATHLLADLFESGQRVEHDYPALVTAFKGRLNDVSVEVRRAAVVRCVALVQKSALLSDQLLPDLTQRLFDGEDKVRATTIKAVCGACTLRVEPFAELLKDIGGRIFDRRPAVRSAARAGVCAIYARQMGTEFKAVAAEEVSPPEGVEWAPARLLQCYGAEAGSDPASRLELEDLLQDKLLPSFADEADAEALHARALTVAHGELAPLQRKAFLSLLRAKRLSQDQLRKWLDLHRAVKEKRASGSAKEEMARVAAASAANFPEPAKAKEVWDAIGASKDGKVAKSLTALAAASSSRADALTARVELRRRLSPHLPASALPLVESMASRPGMLLASSSTAKCLLERVAALVDQSLGAGGGSLPELALLIDVTSVFPEVLGKGGAKLVEVLSAACGSAEVDGAVVCDLLRVVHNVSAQLASEAPNVRRPLVALLCQKCCGKDVEAGRLAAACLTTSVLLPALRDKTFETLATKLAASLKGRAGPQQHTALAALAVFAKRLPAGLGDERAAMLSDVRSELVEASTSTTGAALTAKCESQRRGVKLLANELLGADAAAGKSELEGDAEEGTLVVPGEGAARARAVFELLVRILEAGGAFGPSRGAPAEEQAALRLEAGCALLALARTRSLSVTSVMGPERWHRLGDCMQDEDPDVRAKYALKVYRELMRPFNARKTMAASGAPTPYLVFRKSGLPPRFCPLLALAALDANKANASLAKNYLTSMCRRLRHCAEELKQPHVMPEAQLPWLVHLLAHHAHFEEEYEEDPCLPTTQRCLDFFLSALLAGASEFDLLRTVGNLIKRSSDRASDDSHEVHTVADVAREILAMRGKGGKWSHRPVPSSLRLPQMLYTPAPPGASDGDFDMLPHGFKLLDHVGKGGGGVLAVTGVKRSSPAAKRLSAATPKQRALPSPVGIDTGSAKKARRRSSKGSGSGGKGSGGKGRSKDESSGEESEEEEGGEGGEEEASPMEQSDGEEAEQGAAARLKARQEKEERQEAERSARAKRRSSADDEQGSAASKTPKRRGTPTPTKGARSSATVGENVAPQGSPAKGRSTRARR